MAKRLNMIRLTLVIPMSLNEWLNIQAKLACKSKTRYIEELLKQAKQESDTKNLLDIDKPI